MVLCNSKERGNLCAAAALAFSLLRIKSASLGTKERSEKTALPAIFRLSLPSMSLRDPKMQLLLPSHPTQTRKEAKRKEADWVLWKAEGHPTLRLEVSNAAPACRLQGTDSVRTWNQEVPPIPNNSPLCGHQASLPPSSRAEMILKH